MDLQGKIPEEKGIHRALEPNVQLADLPLGQRYQPDSLEAKLLEEGRHILLVAGKAIESLSHHDVENPIPSVLEQLLIAGPQPTGATACRIASQPPLSSRPCAMRLPQMRT